MDIFTLMAIRHVCQNKIQEEETPNAPEPSFNSERQTALWEVVKFCEEAIKAEEGAIDRYYELMNSGELDG